VFLMYKILYEVWDKNPTEGWFCLSNFRNLIEAQKYLTDISTLRAPYAEPTYHIIKVVYSHIEDYIDSAMKNILEEKDKKIAELEIKIKIQN